MMFGRIGRMPRQPVALGVPGAERPGLADGDLMTHWGRDCPNHLLGD